MPNGRGTTRPYDVEIPRNELSDLPLFIRFLTVSVTLFQLYANGIFNDTHSIFCPLERDRVPTTVVLYGIGIDPCAGHQNPFGLFLFFLDG